MAKVVIAYFKDLFTASQVTNCDNVLSGVHFCIHENMNNELMTEFRAEEVVEAVKSMAPLKASGVDDFSTLLF